MSEADTEFFILSHATEPEGLPAHLAHHEHQASTWGSLSTSLLQAHFGKLVVTLPLPVAQLFMPVVSSLPPPCGTYGYGPAWLPVVPLPWLDEYAQCLLLPETVQKANKINMSQINTSSVTKYTKEEDGGLDGNHMSEAKGASKFPLCLAKILFAKKKLCFEHKFCLALGLESHGGFFLFFFSSCTDFLAIPA